MKEKILESLKGKGTILEQIEDEKFFGIHFTMPGDSRWEDGIHGYLLMEGDVCRGKAYSNGKASTNDRPMTLNEYITEQKEALNIK